MNKKTMINAFMEIVLLPIRLTPFWLLYRLSDGLYLLCYYLFRIRRHTVRYNLKLVFPTLTHTELVKIEKQTYRNFCDVILETLKGFTLTTQEINQRHLIKNVDLLNQFYQEHRSVVLFVPHFNNWEWGASTQAQVKHKLFCAYKKLHNRLIDEWIQYKRQKNGALLIHKEQIARTLLKNRNQISVYALIADQRSALTEKSIQVRFFNQKIACFSGLEFIATKFNYPVVYYNIERVKRGFYESTFILVCDQPKDALPGEISQKCFTLLEEQIKSNPGNWLWLHNRFKK